MYLNVIHLKSGRALGFQSEIPFSVDKVVGGWNVIKCERTGEILSVMGTEIAAITSADADKIAPNKNTNGDKKTAQEAAQGVQKGNNKFKAQITHK